MTDVPARPTAAFYATRRTRALWVLGVVFSAGLLGPPLFLAAARKGVVRPAVPAVYAAIVYPVALGRTWLPNPGNWIPWVLAAAVLTAAAHAALLEAGERRG
ncbi:hypothetical protein [Streptomyces coffeae]|uniref:Uncharacterized protein n=1 Tax=Streptomyces coffeae TaxID=621382 RepID=A0ABS1NKN2_9ACTN|nr:hypothetical protein [Streptomyces coffeae]MBL1100662.1 hypothetical protein [Streptomyces coffeae]